MHFAVLIILTVWPQIILADLPSPHFHQNWVAAALLIETIMQENAAVDHNNIKKDDNADAQLAFLQEVAKRIRFQATHQPTMKDKPDPVNKLEINSLPYGKDWSFLADLKENHAPVCKPDSHKMECQAFLSLQSSQAEEAEVIQALHRFAKHHTENYKNSNIMSYHALLLLRAQNYPECLRILYQVQQSDEKFKLVYNRVQRVYSLNHKASGEVVLRQTL